MYLMDNAAVQLLTTWDSKAGSQAMDTNITHAFLLGNNKKFMT
ncbi:hypothetical protein DSUL_40035 [Desulfovibrionales bacterium]